MKRRRFIKTVGISIGATLLSSPYKLFAEETTASEINYPEEVYAIINNQPVKLHGKGSHWELNNCRVTLDRKKYSIELLCLNYK